MPSNPRVYLDITIGTKAGGRVVFELFNDVAPKTVENFRGLCTGEYGTSAASGLPLCFRGCKFFRVVPGFAAQSGDFECNNGLGGESIYGATFSDESMLRRHCQAGVLSMANRGRNTNSSQFFVTLKKAPHLDGKHVAFGQVVQGMEVIRAIEKCPIDANNIPRVPIVIVDCGQSSRMPGLRKDDPLLQMRDAVQTLMATLDTEQPPQAPAAAQLGLAKLEEAIISKTSLNKKKISATVTVEEKFQQSESTVLNLTEKVSSLEEPNESDDVLDLSDPRQKRLAELRLKLTESRRLNASEVAAEAKRSTDNASVRKHSEARSGNNTEETKKENLSGESGWNLNEPASLIEARDERKKKKQRNIDSNFGWNAMSTDAYYRAHEKKTENLKFQHHEYAKQILKLGDHFYKPTCALVSAEFKPTEEAKERLADMIDKDKTKRKQFRRRRMYVDEENVQYINDFNRSFNQKLEKAYGAQAAEIRQNLERGTAL